MPWFHNCILLDQVKDRPTREWYIRKTIENGWSRSVLELQIETAAHRRVGASQRSSKTDPFVLTKTDPSPESIFARANSAFRLGAGSRAGCVFCSPAQQTLDAVERRVR